MDWGFPACILLIVPAAALLWWFDRRSMRSLSPQRARLLLIVRLLLVLIVLLAIAGPAWQWQTERESVVFIVDHSQSQGEKGVLASYQRVAALRAELPHSTQLGLVSAGAETVVRQAPDTAAGPFKPEQKLLAEAGGQTDLAEAVTIASGLFPPGTGRRIVLIGDGQQTRGDVVAAARNAALTGVVIDAVPLAGDRRPDVRVVGLASDKQRCHEGASIELRADLESSLAGRGRIRLFENGIEVESRTITLEIGDQLSEVFQRAPEERNLYTYRVRVEGFPADQIVENDEAMTLVDVRGRPLLLYIEGEPGQAHYLAEATAKEGIRLQTRSPAAIPQSLQELAGYDGIVLSDVPAHQLSERTMALIRDYVEKLGGGFLMVGGKNSFGVGGYYRTPIEDILPVKMKAPDKEERYATALMLVIDRSGSMSGQKIELCKSAAIATVEMLTPKDYVGVVAFDSSARWIVPITKASNKGTITTPISTVNAGGGTNIFPGMTEGRQALAGVKAKVKHMIVLTDGQTGGSGYQELAAQMHNEGMTISTVGVGSGAAVGLLQTIAAAGGGTFYATVDPTNIPRIFTQDAMVHMGRLVREEAFSPKHVERHTMLRGCAVDAAPQLLGYVKTNRKETAQVPLVTDLGDPLLAHWQFGLGKVTAFTSDCKSRWAALWITNWPSFNQFWAQVLRETARKAQGQNVDVRLAKEAGDVQIHVDVLADAASYDNEAEVTADVYFVAAGSLGSNMKRIASRRLKQTGPGHYQARFRPDEAGVYLVRSRAGAQMVSAGVVHSVSGEAATGRVDEALLKRVCKAAGGALLAADAKRLPQRTATHTRFADLTPLLLKLFLLVFLVDTGIRRWENVRGMWTTLTGGR